MLSQADADKWAKWLGVAALVCFSLAGCSLFWLGVLVDRLVSR